MQEVNHFSAAMIDVLRILDSLEGLEDLENLDDLGILGILGKRLEWKFAYIKKKQYFCGWIGERTFVGSEP